MKEPTAAEILSDLRARLNPPVDDDPSWKTVSEWAAAWELSEPHVRKLLLRATASGSMKAEAKRRLLGQSVRPITCYRYTGRAKP